MLHILVPKRAAQWEGRSIWGEVESHAHVCSWLRVLPLWRPRLFMFPSSLTLKKKYLPAPEHVFQSGSYKA